LLSVESGEGTAASIITMDGTVLLKRLEKGVRLLDNAANLASVTNAVGLGFLVLMMATVVVDVVLRYSGLPIVGALEVVELMQVVFIFLGMAYTANLDRHVSIDLVVGRLPEKVRLFLKMLICALSVQLFVLMAWQNVLQYYRYKELASITIVLQVPIHPFPLIIAFGILLLCLVLLRDLLRSVIQAMKLPLPALAWSALLALILLLPGILLWAGAFPRAGSALTIGALMMVMLFALLFSGMPIGFGLALVGFIVMTYLRNTEVGLSLLGTVPFRMTANFGFTVLPLFALMGTLCFQARISKDLYHAAYCWFGRLPGGLSIATIAGCAGFAAISGDTLTTAVTMGTVSLPEMRRFKYDPELAAGSVAAGGTLGVMIPPSIGFILYGLITNQSIGALFLAGILPGLLLTLLFVLVTLTRCWLNPVLGPRGAATTFQEKFVSLRGSLATLCLFVLVIGGLYAGLFTATEAGAIGSFGALATGIITRRLTWKGFRTALKEAGLITSMVFMILIGADIFGYSLTATKLPMKMASFVAGLPLPGLLILVTILLTYVILGCLMPTIAMIILTLPIFYPTVQALGYDPIWFGVIMVLMMEMAVITPPIGVNVFGIFSVAKDIPLYTIFRGILPYISAIVALIMLLIAFPRIATFLPALMGFVKS
jgi:tripartite ATP-independent transporter DctM subunit